MGRLDPGGPLFETEITVFGRGVGERASRGGMRLLRRWDRAGGEGLRTTLSAAFLKLVARVAGQIGRSNFGCAPIRRTQVREQDPRLPEQTDDSESLSRGSGNEGDVRGTGTKVAGHDVAGK